MSSAQMTLASAKSNWLTPRLAMWTLAVLWVTYLVYNQYALRMDEYEKGILVGTALGAIWLGWFWSALQGYIGLVLALSWASLSLYAANGDQIIAKETNFFLKYFLSSQSAIMWMNVLLILAMFTYFFALWRKNDFWFKVGKAEIWAAAVFGFVGMMARWNESYLINPDYGHIPVSNLYEVFILFILLTVLIYLYMEKSYKTQALGGFVLIVVNAAVLFVLWYVIEREADKIMPLVPALKSYWMKIHVPANFVGYGAFAIASMVGVVYLIRNRMEKRVPASDWLERLPNLNTLDDFMYKSIGVGFVFFTIATILGAVWAAEAWGGYWSWDPKETWALIVWLNYAAWLHFRVSKGWRGDTLAWWAIIGLFVVTFAFLGVNMFLSGLHSYGTL